MVSYVWQRVGVSNTSAVPTGRRKISEVKELGCHIFAYQVDQSLEDWHWSQAKEGTCVNGDHTIVSQR